MRPGPAAFRVLAVSTGNVCRSPMAEAMLRHALATALGPAAHSFAVQSVGTWGHEGSPMEPYAEQVLAERGVPVGPFAARELAPEHLVAAEHREVVRAVDPFAAVRTYTLAEFARYVRMVDPASLPAGEFVARARVLVEQVAMLRGGRPGRPRSGEDLADPLGAPLHVFRLCGERLAEHLDSFVRALEPTWSAERATP
jgi:protein-tyrosine phosphatase